MILEYEKPSAIKIDFIVLERLARDEKESRDSGDNTEKLDSFPEAGGGVEDWG